MDTTPHLDGLILNAAEARRDLVLTDEGIETNFATNHLAGFLLTHLLLPRLRAAAPSRVVAISSAVHTQVRMVDLSSVVTGAPLTPDSYRTSKLLNILFVRELARRLEGKGITANAADPGFVRTNLGRHAAGGRRIMHAAARPMQSSPERAAVTPVYLATSDELAGVTGGYYANRHPLGGERAGHEREACAEAMERERTSAREPSTGDSQRDDCLWRILSLPGWPS